MSSSVYSARPRVQLADLTLAHALLLGAGLHFLIWSIAPLFFIENLHYDTLELVYWGRDWMLGYGKHPPLGTYVVDLAMRASPLPLLNLMVLAQCCVALSGYFLWKAARLFVPENAALLAVLVFYASPEASFYAVQLNHNTLLMPLWTASLFATLRYFEQQSWRNALVAGALAGLAMLMKYQVAILFMTLLILAASVPRYRRAFIAPASLLAIVVMGLVMLPHLLWLAHNQWSTLTYALDSRDVQNWHDFFDALNNGLVGPLVLLIGPAIVLGLTKLFGFGFALNREKLRVALILAAAPPLLLWLGAIASLQDPKQSWFLIFMPNVALAFAMLVKWQPPRIDSLIQRKLIGALPLVSVGQFVVFMSFLALSNAWGRPIMVYDLRASRLAVEVEEVWHDYQAGPLQCVVVNETKVGGSTVLWLKDRANYVDFSSQFWSGPQRIADCAKTGGVAILDKKHSSQLVKAAFPSLCPQSMVQLDVPTRFGRGTLSEPVELIYFSPAGREANGRCTERDETVADREL